MGLMTGFGVHLSFKFPLNFSKRLNQNVSSAASVLVLFLNLASACSEDYTRLRIALRFYTNTPGQMYLLRVQVTPCLLFLLLLYDPVVTRLVQIFDAAHGHQSSASAYVPRIDFPVFQYVTLAIAHSPPPPQVGWTSSKTNEGLRTTVTLQILQLDSVV